MLGSRKAFDINTFNGNLYINTKTRKVHTKGAYSMEIDGVETWKSLASSAMAQKFKFGNDKKSLKLKITIDDKDYEGFMVERDGNTIKIDGVDYQKVEPVVPTSSVSANP
ncbi:hypothetical protein ACFORL_10850 [Legionella dresdenensis]|uniref:Uncharacterized protein n=1 Tax=Legionella dresdenensis TaxID=450200 RepID=A0ABV8CHI5_9GAMM